MSVILKWPLHIADLQYVPVAEGARLLTVQMQRDIPMLWVLNSKEAVVKHRKIAIYGTGNPMPDDPGEYVATFQDGSFVWHVFDMGEVA